MQKNISIDAALKKGKFQLLWMPMILFFLLLGSGTFIGPYSSIAGIVLFLSAFIVPWLWWSFKVVKWKIWAFTSVEDVRTLEKRAIAQQLIWPHGSFFEKTEIKNKHEQKILEGLYDLIENSTSKREIIHDNNLPLEMVIRYPKWMLLLYLGICAGSIWLITTNWILGVIGATVGAALFIDYLIKVKRRPFLLKLSHSGIVLSNKQISWADIKEYYIEKSGFGESTTFSLVLLGDNVYESIPLSDTNVNAFQLEKYLDVYRSRYETIKQLGKNNF